MTTQGDTHKTIPLDPQRFYELTDTLEMDVETVKSFVLQRFIGTVTEVLPALSACLERGDAVGVRQKAHQLKGSSLNAGAHVLAGIFLTLEEMGKKGELTQAPRECERSQQEFERFKDYLASADFPPQRVEGAKS